MATETLSGNSDNQGWFSSWKSCNLDCSQQKFQLRESYSKCTKLFTSLVHSKCTKLYASDWWFRTDSLSITATSVMVLGAGESPPRKRHLYSGFNNNETPHTDFQIHALPLHKAVFYLFKLILF
ncbi:hypothetical protein M8J77_009061 [Diaphorina citri]|nr:hypothetical protein M8J77_009061 [Diaphorina citri]